VPNSPERLFFAFPFTSFPASASSLLCPASTLRDWTTAAARRRPRRRTTHYHRRLRRRCRDHHTGRDNSVCIVKAVVFLLRSRSGGTSATGAGAAAATRSTAAAAQFSLSLSLSLSFSFTLSQWMEKKEEEEEIGWLLPLTLLRLLLLPRLVGRRSLGWSCCSRCRCLGWLEQRERESQS
jgi:hypothetical protein